MSNQLPRRPRRPPPDHALRVVRPAPRNQPSPDQSAQSSRAAPRIRPKGKPGSLWYAVSLPHLRSGNIEERIAKERLQQFAAALGCVSATVSIQSPDSLVFEVRSTLNYFGSIENIRLRVQALLDPLLLSWGADGGFQQAVSPTPAASLLLARSGCNLLIYRKENLRSALGSLPLDALAPQMATRTRNQKQQTRRLHNSGLQVMRDIWRLPRQALAQRFGPDFIRQLDSCLGHVAMPINAYQAAPFFSTGMDFDYAVENTGFLLHAADELLNRLCLYLRQRELAAGHLQLRLRHEQREETLIELELRLASRSLSHLSLLLETRIDTLVLQAPVIGLQLEVRRFDAFTTRHEGLSGVLNAAGNFEEISAESPDQSAILVLLEQLQARLGNDAVRSLHVHAGHGPELAGSSQTFAGVGRSRTSAPGAAPGIASDIASTAPVAARPCWILDKPSALLPQDFRTLQLLSGPERIETHWWDGKDIQRDYYVARNNRGMRLWIYHDRKGERDWYLHGIFD